MIKLLPLFFFVSSYIAGAQNYNLILKKRNKTLDNFWKGSMIGFQTNNKAWLYGEIISIKKDSLTVKPLMIQYGFMRADTIRSYPVNIALKDIHALPKPGNVVDYDMGRFRINRASNNVPFMWLKSGGILIKGALAFAVLNVGNSAFKNDLSVKNNGPALSVAVAVLLAGIAIGEINKPRKYIIGKKYRLQANDLTNE